MIIFYSVSNQQASLLSSDSVLRTTSFPKKIVILKHVSILYTYLAGGVTCNYNMFINKN